MIYNCISKEKLKRFKLVLMRMEKQLTVYKVQVSRKIDYYNFKLAIIDF